MSLNSWWYYADIELIEFYKRSEIKRISIHNRYKSKHEEKSIKIHLCTFDFYK